MALGRFLDRIEFRDSYLATRDLKARKILKVLEDQNIDFSASALVDVGCSRGLITACLSEKFKFTVGVDLDPEVERPGDKFHFVQADGCHLPFASDTFDVVVINHIIEHVASAGVLLGEVMRILKRGGLCYLACPNRWNILEPHYRLPFLSWLPRAAADRYVRWCRRGDRYLDNLPGYFRLKRLTSQFEVRDETIRVLKNRRRFLEGDPDSTVLHSVLARLPSGLLRLLLPVAPVWIWLLRKPTSAA